MQSGARPRSYTKHTEYSFSTHEEGITAPDNLYTLHYSSCSFVRDHINEWRKTLSKWPTFVEQNPAKARELVRAGIPAEIRGEAWKIISGGDGLKAKNPGVYEVQPGYKELYGLLPQKDITRTYPTNKHFRLRGGAGQKALYNVLKVYSIMDPEVGYCQGMSFLCGVLVYNLSEIDAFWVLSAMLKGTNPPLRSLFLDGLPLLKKYIFRFNRLFEILLPRLFDHFTNLGINSLFFSAEWFTTVFSYNTPIEVTARIWDVILFEGPDYLLVLALAMLKVSQKKLYDLQFDSTLSYLKAKTSRLRVSIIEEADMFLDVVRTHLPTIDEEFFKTEIEAKPRPDNFKPVRDKDYKPPALPPRRSARNPHDLANSSNSSSPNSPNTSICSKASATHSPETRGSDREGYLPPKEAERPPKILQEVLVANQREPTVPSQNLVKNAPTCSEGGQKLEMRISTEKIPIPVWQTEETSLTSSGEDPGEGEDTETDLEKGFREWLRIHTKV